MNSASVRIFLSLIAISLISSETRASRSVPQDYVAGIESVLPANYDRLFELEDKTSNDYVVLSFQITADLMNMATEAKRSGNYLQSYRFLRLANHLFPHRGDVSQKYQAIGRDIVSHLNGEAQCNGTYEKLLTEIKKSYPGLLNSIQQTKCPDINESVREVGSTILDQEKKLSQEQDLKALSLQEKVNLLSKKAELNEADQAFLNQSIWNAYLGHLEFISHHLTQTSDDSLIVQFELTRKNSALSLKGLKASGEFLRGEIKLHVHFVQNDKVTVYPVSIIVNRPEAFDVWLKTINFFNFSQYPHPEIAYQNDPFGFQFVSKDLELGFAQSPRLHLNLNQIEFKKVPKSVLKNLKRVSISSQI